MINLRINSLGKVNHGINARQADLKKKTEDLCVKMEQDLKSYTSKNFE